MCVLPAWPPIRHMTVKWEHHIDALLAPYPQSLLVDLADLAPWTPKDSVKAQKSMPRQWGLRGDLNLEIVVLIAVSIVTI